MRLKTKFENFAETTKRDFRNVGRDMTKVFEAIHSLRITQSDFIELRQELATNGVVRDLRKAQKQLATQEARYQELENFVMDKFARLETNGVATSINKLNAEVFGERKEVERSATERVMLAMSGYDTEEDTTPTLRGVVNAVLDHLKLDVEVQPEKKTPAKVVAKKVKEKKGRR